MNERMDIKAFKLTIENRNNGANDKQNELTMH